MHPVNVIETHRDGTRGRKCRDAVKNPKKFPASPITTILKGYSQNAFS